MDDLMARLVALLSGPQANTGAAPYPAMQPRPSAMAPMAWGGADGDHFTPIPLDDDGNKDKDKPKDKPDDKGDPKNRRHHRSPYDKAVDRASLGGPSKYTNIMKKNLGMNEPTLGYGKPIAPERTGLTRLLDLFGGGK